MSRRRVVLVDDHDLFRAGVRSELGKAVDIVGEAGSVTEAVPLIRELDPDVVLLDVHLPDGGGQAVIAQVAPERPGVRFLALSVSDAAEDVIGVIRAGARGYVTKSISGVDLIEAVKRTADGDAVFSPRLAGFVLDAFRSGSTAERPGARRTDDARARGAAADRTRVPLQGDRGAAAPVRQDGRDPRLGSPPKAAALEPARAHALGRGAPVDLETNLEAPAEEDRPPQLSRSAPANRCVCRQRPPVDLPCDECRTPARHLELHDYIHPRRADGRRLPPVEQDRRFLPRSHIGSRSPKSAVGVPPLGRQEDPLDRRRNSSTVLDLQEATRGPILEIEGCEPNAETVDRDLAAAEARERLRDLAAVEAVVRDLPDAVQLPQLHWPAQVDASHLASSAPTTRWHIDHRVRHKLGSVVVHGLHYERTDRRREDARRFDRLERPVNVTSVLERRADSDVFQRIGWPALQEAASGGDDLVHN